MTIGDVAGLIVALATTGSLIYISRQVNVTRLQTKGQFLLALDDQFEKFGEITIHLMREADFTPAGSQWGEVWRMMSVFERINIMVEDNILDIELVDRLYGFRLIGIIANDPVYERLKLSAGEWQDFVDLCYKVADERGSTENVIDRDKSFVERVHSLNKEARKLSNPFGF